MSINSASASKEVSLFETVKQHYLRYRSGDTPLISDSEYDQLEAELLRIDPEALDKIEAELGQKHFRDSYQLPHTMAGLVQLEDAEDVMKWTYDLHNDDALLVLSEKLDGISAMLEYDEKGKLRRAFSKHTGHEGKDITRHVRLIPSVQQEITPTGDKCYIRGEIIMTRDTFSIKYSEVYKNARNGVSGMVMSKAPNKENMKNCLFVAYTIEDSMMDKIDEFEKLESEGFRIPYHWSVPVSEADFPYLEESTKKTIEQSDYELDGIVINVNDQDIAEELGSEADGMKSKSARKFKIVRDDNYAETEVEGVLWALHKDGHFRPRIKIKPVELMGVTVTHASAFNAFFIVHGHLKGEADKDKKPIGPGAKISIIRSGDVIPDIQDVLVPASEPHLPSQDEYGEMCWTSSGIHLQLIDMNNPQIRLRNVCYFFNQLKVEGFRNTTVAKYFNEGFETVGEIIKAVNSHYLPDGVKQKTHLKIKNSLNEILSDIPLYKIAAASNIFGQAIGETRLKQLYDVFEGDLLDWQGKAYKDIYNTIMRLHGWEHTTTSAVIDNIDAFNDFFFEIETYVTLSEYEPKGSVFENEVIAFTGFRNQEWQDLIEKNGGEVKGVSKKTTMLICADPSSNSGKMKKARELSEETGLVIMSIDEFRDELDKLLELDLA